MALWRVRKARSLSPLLLELWNSLGCWLRSASRRWSAWLWAESPVHLSASERRVEFGRLLHGFCCCSTGRDGWRLADWGRAGDSPGAPSRTCAGSTRAESPTVGPPGVACTRSGFGRSWTPLSLKPTLAGSVLVGGAWVASVGALLVPCCSGAAALVGRRPVACKCVRGSSVRRAAEQTCAPWCSFGMMLTGSGALMNYCAACGSTCANAATDSGAGESVLARWRSLG